ncbi:helix-turn-helix domain-containing protein [Bradyrhizobium sp. SZCCHNS3051]|uniref:helix-turn-helix domain-containing protein n=1 Tax=Bradyrhizobium sp. SZCCHNS3051 TaxID=3057320 RepID=UPI0029164DF2|nr:helix-turn-helix domain-containing protein [Bradyrhizobium sp. SZCCHNS3051]
MKNVAPGSNIFKTIEAATDAQAKRSFTSEKLDLINAMNADDRLPGDAIKVALSILAHVNHVTRVGWPCVETISRRTRLHPRQVERMLAILRKSGWLTSKRVYHSGKVHNHYRFETTNINMVLDEQAALDEAAKGRLAEPRNRAAKVRTNPTTLSDCPTRQPDKPVGLQPDSPVGVTPSGRNTVKDYASKKKVSVVEREADGGDRTEPDGWPNHNDRDFNDGDDSEGAWLDRVFGIGGPPPSSRAEIIAQARAFVRQHAPEMRQP